MRVVTLIGLSTMFVALLSGEPSTEQFIVKKTNKKEPSTSQKKEDMCQQVSDTLKGIAHVTEGLMIAQQELFAIAGAIIDDNCLGSCGKQEINTGYQHADAMNQCMQDFQDDLVIMRREVAALKKAIVKA